MNEDQIDIEKLVELADTLIHDHNELIDTLISLRKKKKLTQTDVAQRMNVSQPAISQFESEETNPTLQMIRRYAIAVGARITTKVEDNDQNRSQSTYTLFPNISLEEPPTTPRFRSLTTVAYCTKDKVNG